VQIATLAAHHAIPTSFSTREPVEAGGLISYGTKSLMHIVKPASTLAASSRREAGGLARRPIEQVRTRHQRTNGTYVPSRCRDFSV
jgi:hypothetical protein